MMRVGDIYYDVNHPERGCFVVIKPLKRNDPNFNSAVAFDGDGVPVYTLEKDYCYVAHTDLIEKLFANLKYCDAKAGRNNDKN